MNTPGHAVINLALLSHLSPQANLAIVCGAVLPDLPIFGFYMWAKFVDRLPEREIWQEAYLQPRIQTVVATFHSIPIALGCGLVSYLCGWEIAQIICLSCLLHSLEDIPVHNHDAHRHFFPLSNYRFISPFSYWDSRHYGNIVAAIELSLVFAMTLWVFPRVSSISGQILLIVANLYYWLGYFTFYLRKRHQHPCQIEKTLEKALENTLDESESAAFAERK
ncbi:MAG: hypothetical protein SWY16_03610 [Cyanobacteriota bacterium]|nr:hypothetical protein [Cyanobacteriota bacterium]